MIRNTRGMQNNDLPIDWSDIQGAEWCWSDCKSIQNECNWVEASGIDLKWLTLIGNEINYLTLFWSDIRYYEVIYNTLNSFTIIWLHWKCLESIWNAWNQLKLIQIEWNRQNLHKIHWKWSETREECKTTTCKSIGLISKVLNGVEVISNRFKMNGIEWKQVELIWNDWY